MLGTKHLLFLFAFWQMFTLTSAPDQLDIALDTPREAKPAHIVAAYHSMDSDRQSDEAPIPTGQPEKEAESEKDSEEKDLSKERLDFCHKTSTAILSYIIYQRSTAHQDSLPKSASIPLYLLFHCWKGFLI
jgi:hypothetical protein